MSLVVTAVAGVVFGLAIAAPPGPVNALIAEESVLRGWLAGVTAGLGALTADAIFFALAARGAVAVVETYPALRGVMVGAGGLLMCYFAYDAARGARAVLAPDAAATDGAASGRRGFWRTLALGLTNPYQILFWLTVGVGMVQPGRLDVLEPVPVLGEALAGTFVVATGSPALVVAFFAGIVVWVAGFPAALVAAERRVEALAPVVAGASAVVLAGFGAFFLVDAATTLA